MTAGERGAVSGLTHGLSSGRPAFIRSSSRMPFGSAYRRSVAVAMIFNLS